MLKNIKYGFVGVGYLGNYHIQQIQKINHVKIVGCYDLNNAHGRSVAENYNIPAFNDVLDLLELCDAVSVATPASHHFNVTKKALESNCHVFIEKPIAHDINQARELLLLSEKHDKLIQVGHIERFNPVFQYFKKTLPSPKFIEAHRLAPFSVRGIDVNVVLDLMIHDIDLVLNLMGKRKIKNIDANGVNILSDSTDLANARIEFDNNLIVNLTASRISSNKMRKMRIFESQKYSSLNFDAFTVDIYASKNHKDIVNEKILFEFENKTVSLESIQLEANNALYEELDAFINSIVYSTKVVVGASEAILALEVALQIEKQINATKQR